jgi:hypothetical protein
MADHERARSVDDAPAEHHTHHQKHASRDHLHRQAHALGALTKQNDLIHSADELIRLWAEWNNIDKEAGESINWPEWRSAFFRAMSGVHGDDVDRLCQLLTERNSGQLTALGVRHVAMMARDPEHLEDLIQAFDASHNQPAVVYVPAQAPPSGMSRAFNAVKSAVAAPFDAIGEIAREDAHSRGRRGY